MPKQPSLPIGSRSVRDYFPKNGAPIRKVARIIKSETIPSLFSLRDFLGAITQISRNAIPAGRNRLPAIPTTFEGKMSGQMKRERLPAKAAAQMSDMIGIAPSGAKSWEVDR